MKFSSAFIMKPNTPKREVCSVLIGERYHDLLKSPLAKLGIAAITVPENPLLSVQTASHPDMSLLHIGGNKVLVSASIFDNIAHLYDEGLDCVSSNFSQDSKYPNDVGLNVCIVGNVAMHRLHCTAQDALRHLQIRYRLEDVAQGYTKCSVCVVNERAIITADPSIASAAGKLGIDVLQISPGYIELPGHDTGFIGGASGLLSPNVLCFTGRIDHHPDVNRIYAFAEAHKVSILCLTDKPCFDVGSIIPIKERL